MVSTQSPPVRDSAGRHLACGDPTRSPGWRLSTKRLQLVANSHIFNTPNCHATMGGPGCFTMSWKSPVSLSSRVPGPTVDRPTHGRSAVGLQGGVNSGTSGRGATKPCLVVGHVLRKFVSCKEVLEHSDSCAKRRHCGTTATNCPLRQSMQRRRDKQPSPRTRPRGPHIRSCRKQSSKLTLLCGAAVGTCVEKGHALAELLEHIAACGKRVARTEHFTAGVGVCSWTGAPH